MEATSTSPTDATLQRAMFELFDSILCPELPEIINLVEKAEYVAERRKRGSMVVVENKDVDGVRTSVIFRVGYV